MSWQIVILVLGIVWAIVAIFALATLNAIKKEGSDEKVEGSLRNASVE